jgi:hypothetical protein
MLRVVAVAVRVGVEIAAACGTACEADVERVAVLADRLVGMHRLRRKARAWTSSARSASAPMRNVGRAEGAVTWA